MKKILLAALLAIGVSSVSLAQGPPSPEEQIAALKTSLTLTDAQVEKVKPIFAASAKTMDSLMQSMQNGGDPSKMMGGFTKMNDVQVAKVKAILTPQQLPIYQKQVDERAEMMKRWQQGQN
jgi:protein CpxP